MDIFCSIKTRFDSLLICLMVAVAACWLLGGCTLERPGQSLLLKLWAANEMRTPSESLNYDPADSVFEPEFNTSAILSGGVVRLRSCANDQVGVIIVAEAAEEDIKDLRISCKSPVGEDAAAGDELIGVKLYRIAPVGPLEAPSWSVLENDPAFPAGGYSFDALLEIAQGGLPNSFDIAAGKRTFFWLDLDVSPLVAAGVYKSDIILSFRNGSKFGRARASLALELEVLNILLPDAIAYGRYDHRELLAHALENYHGPKRKHTPERRSGQFDALSVIRQLQVSARAHGLDLLDIALAPDVSFKNAGRAGELKWGAYDSLSAPYLDGSAFDDKMAMDMWLAPVDGEFPSASRYVGDSEAVGDSDEYIEAIKDFTRQCASHFENIHAKDRLYYTANASDLTPLEFVTWAGAVKDAGSAARIISPYPGYETASVGAVEADKISAIVSDYALNAEQIIPQKVVGKNIWLSGGEVPFTPAMSTGATAADIRAACWLAQRYCDRRILLGNVLDWGLTDSTDAMNLYYPGRWWKLPGVVETRRLKALRRGLSDLALMRLLEMRGCESDLREIVSAMTGSEQAQAIGRDFFDATVSPHTRDGQIWQLAGKLLQARFNKSASTPLDAEKFKREYEILKLRFDSHLNRLRVDSFNTKIEPLGSADKAAEYLKLTLDVDVVNDRRETAAFVMELPPDAGDIEKISASSFGELATNDKKQFTFSVKCRPDAFDSGGHLQIPVWFRTGSYDSDKYGFTASLINATKNSERISIDGSLSDWSLGSCARAGDFTVVGRRGNNFIARQVSDTKASQSTDVFVCRDDEFLYIAAQCRTGDGELRCRLDNMQRFSRQWPVGEDFFEVVLNPAMRAAGPNELYRLTVKANGVAISYRGLPVSDKFADYSGSVWLSDARVAVKRYAGSWIAEIAIPLKNIPGTDQLNCMWGVNFIRCSTSSNELTNWAARPKYLYNPDEMGHMYWE